MTVDPWLRLYPGPWRRRYSVEVSALLDEHPPSWRDRLDLLAGALDAHLHPLAAPTWPVLAAAIGGIAWTFAGAVALGQPAPPDWPGYLEETLAIFLGAVPLLALATLGASTRLGDRDPAIARVGRALVVLASVVWAVLLAIAIARLGGDFTLAIAATATAGGILLIGLALLGAGDAWIGAALLLAALCLVIPATWAQVAFGVAWTVVAVGLLLDPRPVRIPPVIGR